VGFFYYLHLKILTFHAEMDILLKPYKSNPVLKFRLSGCLLLIVYLFIYLIPPGLIPHTEHDHLGQLDQSAESDPCHITIFHPWATGGCHHKYHITSSNADCPLCHVTLVRQNVPESSAIPEIAYCIISFTDFSSNGTVVQFPILHDDRGPPFSWLS